LNHQKQKNENLFKEYEKGKCISFVVIIQPCAEMKKGRKASTLKFSQPTVGLRVPVGNSEIVGFEVRRESNIYQQKYHHR
jgi:hypothetical protein